MSLSDQAERLLRVFEEGRYLPPAELQAALEALPPVDALPPPWVAWTAIGLARYREKILRAREILAPVLGTEWQRGCGRATLDDAALERFTSAQSEWELLCLGQDLALGHTETGEMIHVDTVNNPEVIQGMWFHVYLGSRKKAGSAEARCVELYSGGKGFGLATEELADAGLIDAVDAVNFKACERLRCCSDAIAAFADAWEGPADRVWLGAVVNDWPAAHEAAQLSGDPALERLTAERAERCRHLRRESLRSRVAASGLTGDLLSALAAAQAEEVPKYLEDALREPTQLTHTALVLIRDDPAWCPLVYRLFEGQDDQRRAGGEIDRAAEYLVKHGHRAPEVLRRLGTTRRDYGQAAVLALRYRPDLAMAPLRQALRWYSHRAMAAAALAVIDRPWSRRELTSVLDESTDHAATLECRLALRESRIAEAHCAADAWERENPESPADHPKGQGGADPWSSWPPSLPRDEAAQDFAHWMAKLRPLHGTAVESPAPYTDMLGA